MLTSSLTAALGRLAVVIGLQAAGSAAAHAQGPASNRTFDVVIEGMSCRQNQNGRMDCEYVVAQALRFSIAGVGEEGALISFSKVDSTAGYVAGFSSFHGCVVVRPAAAGDTSAALAFVSPRDGRVYRVWQHCRQPPRR